MGLANFIDAFRALGLEPHESVSSDISPESIKTKITNPGIARSLGGNISLPIIEKLEWCANLLDSFSASLNENYLLAAQRLYTEILEALPPSTGNAVETVVASIFNYFSHERTMKLRFKRGDSFVYGELVEHLLKRGSDSLVYAIVLVELDQIHDPGLTSGLRLRQAFWDLADDMQDLEMDRKTKGVNLLLLARYNYPIIRTLADDLFRQAAQLTDLVPLKEAIEREYTRAVEKLQALKT